MFTEKFLDCINHDGIVSVATADKTGKVHIANSWNNLIIVKEDIFLIPCGGYKVTEANYLENPSMEIVIASNSSNDGKGSGFLLEGKAEFVKEGELFSEMHNKCSWCNRALVFKPSIIKQTI